MPPCRILAVLPLTAACVPWRAELLGLFVVKAEGGCSACLSSDLNASRCRPVQAVEPQQ